MTKPILLQIRKKKTVPTKYQLKHHYRSDWIPVGYVDYAFSKELFDKIKNEAQFAKLIYDNYGPGVYSVICFRKKHKGFRSFWKGELLKDGFKRLPKNKPKNKQEAEDIRRDIREVEEKIRETENPDEIDNLQEEKAELYEDLEGENKKGSKVGHLLSHYLKSSTPIYKFHGYDSYKNKSETAVNGENVEVYY